MHNNKIVQSNKNVHNPKAIHKHGQQSTQLTSGSMNSKTISMSAMNDKVS